MKKQKSGVIIVISGPTGSGESAITKEILKRFKKTEKLITFTSRPKRKTEKNGRDNYFISVQEFKKRIKNGDFLEYIFKRGNYYGTSKHLIERKLKKGINLMANIDWDGTKKIRKAYPDTLTIFISPDEFSNIKKRLLNRQPDMPAKELAQRLKSAKQEMEEAEFYDIIVKNPQGKLKQTINEVEKIIKKHLVLTAS